MIVNIAVPIGPSVCRPSVRLRNPIPRDVTEVVKAGIELRATGLRAAHAVVGEDAGGPGLLKRVELKLGVLVGGADPCVANDCHHCSCLIIPSIPRF
jgi:hypothetical protein